MNLKIQVLISNTINCNMQYVGQTCKLKTRFCGNGRRLIKVVRYVTFPKCQWRSIKIFIYSYNKIRQPSGSRIEKRQCDVIMTALAPQKDHPKTTFLIVFPG